MQYEHSAGAVIFHKGKFLILHYELGHWDFVKGHVEPGEKELETVKRETYEETGLKDIKIIPGFKEKITYFYKRSGKLIKKTVSFYLAKTKTTKIKLSFEHVGYLWLPYENALNQITFENSKKILKKAMKFLELEKIAKKVKRCKKCRLYKTRKNAVPGEGSYKSKIIIIGEAPGAKEDEQGKPFVGRAGRLLDELLKIANIKREEVFITNVIKCRPPNNRNPKFDEIHSCLPYLKRQIEILNPKLIILLGRIAINTLLGKYNLSKNHGKILGKYFLTYHPAAGIRFKSIKEHMISDFKQLKKILAKL